VAIEGLLQRLCDQRPGLTLLGYSHEMQKRYGVSLDRNWISRALSRLDYSEKLMSRRSWHKYTPENLKAYGDYMADVRSIPLGHIKFLDEAHFNSKGTMCRLLYRARDFLVPVG
jgi:hypothetical protein